MDTRCRGNKFKFLVGTSLDDILWISVCCALGLLRRICRFLIAKVLRHYSCRRLYFLKDLVHTAVPASCWQLSIESTRVRPYLLVGTRVPYYSYRSTAVYTRVHLLNLVCMQSCMQRRGRRFTLGTVALIDSQRYNIILNIFFLKMFKVCSGLKFA